MDLPNVATVFFNARFFPKERHLPSVVIAVAFEKKRGSTPPTALWQVPLLGNKVGACLQAMSDVENRQQLDRL